ncbi:sigma-70 family RNA polymerase sigma factor (plasmid) [Streptomyces sp. NEAU-sy36]|uniref:RNA polymerase sigma factor n=1 Tax=unclassified Streptomyces TaxID=2593676 RepID=UPI0015D61F48|nr:MULTISPECIES: sigma-70 family RNA polymerase sigma factor [unclassified Streptomyces]QLJ06682.1 sigma-70 family RNA polymerase sigma factor [Streptomyces sp. NEAU-sy36]
MDRIDQPLSAALAARLDRLFRLYSTRLLSYTRTLTRDADAAQDVAAEAWTRAARSLPTFEGTDYAAYIWLRTIARNAAADYYTRYERPEDWTEEISSRVLPAAASAEDVALAEPPAPATEVAELLAALDALPEQDRSVVRLRMQGETWEAIGRSYGRTCGAACSRYQRVLSALRSAVAA